MRPQCWRVSPTLEHTDGGKLRDALPLGCPGPGRAALGSLVRRCVLGVWPLLLLGTARPVPDGFTWVRSARISQLRQVPNPLQSGQTHVQNAGIRNHLSQSLSLLSARCDPLSWTALGGLPSNLLITAYGQRGRWLCGLTFKKTHFMALSF